MNIWVALSNFYYHCELYKFHFLSMKPSNTYKRATKIIVDMLNHKAIQVMQDIWARWDVLEIPPKPLKDFDGSTPLLPPPRMSS